MENSLSLIDTMLLCHPICNRILQGRAGYIGCSHGRGETCTVLTKNDQSCAYLLARGKLAPDKDVPYIDLESHCD